MAKDKKIILPGGAGLVGQNLAVRLYAQGYRHIVVLDKHQPNLAILQKHQAYLTAEYADLATPGDWQRHFEHADVVVMLQAQIGGHDYAQFVRNNIDSTGLILDAIKRYQVPSLIHISSSVVESLANDFYRSTKQEQEQLVLASDLANIVLRPTLMFGWFDRKHLGWLARFMKKCPLFPIPAEGRYMRQPLYVGDFCQIIIRCIENPDHRGIYNISGHEKIDYIDMIRTIRQITQAHTWLIHLPFSVFYALLWLWGLIDKNPPFSTQQLIALSTPDEFEVIDWPTLFDVPYTPFIQAIDETFNNPCYSQVVLKF